MSVQSTKKPSGNAIGGSRRRSRETRIAPQCGSQKDLASGYGYERCHGGPAGQIKRCAMHERNIQYGKMRLPDLMELYLLRHGIADDDSPTGKDADRPLTDEGRRKLRDTF